MRFEWDAAKNLINQRKHGISFEEASQVFLDPLHIVVAGRERGAVLADPGACQEGDRKLAAAGCREHCG